MVKTRQSSKNEKKTSLNMEKNNIIQSNKREVNKNLNMKSQVKKCSTPPKKQQLSKQKLSKIEWAPKAKTRQKLSDLKNNKTKQTLMENDLLKLHQQYQKLQELQKEYSYFQDQQDSTKIVSYLNQEAFSIILKKDKNQFIKLLQQIRSIDRLMHKNEDKIKPLLRYCWEFYDPKFFENNEVRKIISHIKLTNGVGVLKLKTNPQSLYMFSHINFDSLLKLNITGTNITSLQPLTWLECPNVRQIYINEITISSIKPLNKMKFNNCDRLKLKNLLIPYPMLDRMKLSKEIDPLIVLTKRKETFNTRVGRYADQQEELFVDINVQDIKSMCKVQGLFDTLQTSFYPKNMIKQRQAFLAMKRKQKINQSDLQSEQEQQQDQLEYQDQYQSQSQSFQNNLNNDNSDKKV